MRSPSQAHLKRWFVYSEEWLEIKYKQVAAGKVSQAQYASIAELWADKGRIYFIRGENENALCCFKEAVSAQTCCFKMAFDSDFEHYIGDLDPVQDWSDVDENSGIILMSNALLAQDYAYAKALCQWPRVIPERQPDDMEVCNFVYGLRDTLKGDWEVAQKYIQATIKKYERRKQPPIKNGRKHDFYSCTIALAGILEKNEWMFNAGLADQLECYKSNVQSHGNQRIKAEFFCDKAIALANLGIVHGLKVTVEDCQFFKHAYLLKSESIKLEKA